MTDAHTEAVLCILPGHSPSRLYLTNGPRPSDPALAAVVALCSLGAASYVAMQAGDGAVVEVTAIAADRAKDALEAAVVDVELPQVDARAVLDGEGPVTVVG